MSTKQNWKSMITFGVALGLTLAAPAWAHGPGRGDLGGTPPPGAPPPGAPRPPVAHARGLLAKLIFPCAAECADKAQACNETAEDKALTCISTTACVDDEVLAAQTACGADRASQACYEAVSAVQTCSASSTCLTTWKSDGAECRADFTTCRTACDPTE